MQRDPQAASPLEVWTTASLATATASMELAANTTAAAMSIWSAALTPLASIAASAEERPAPGRKPAAERRRDPLPAARTSGGLGSVGSASASRVQAPSAPAPGRSWYKAPYRSPFDPLFWLTPGHPVDHASDWLMPWLGAGAMRHAMRGGPSAGAGAGGGMASLAVAMGGAPWLAGPWTAWIERLAEAQRDSVAAFDNVLDFGAAYAAYRTAGGHASAQIIRNSGSESPMPRAEATRQDTSPAMWPWLMPFGSWARR